MHTRNDIDRAYTKLTGLTCNITELINASASDETLQKKLFALMNQQLSAGWIREDYTDNGYRVKIKNFLDEVKSNENGDITFEGFYDKLCETTEFDDIINTTTTTTTTTQYASVHPTQKATSTATSTATSSATPTPTPVIKYQYEINYWSESGDEWVTKTGPERTNTVPQAEEEALLDEYTANCYKGDDDYYIDMQYTKWVTVNSSTTRKPTSTATSTATSSATPSPTPIPKYYYEIHYYAETAEDWVTKNGPERTERVMQAEEEALLDEFTANKYDGDDDYYIGLQYTKWVTETSATTIPSSSTDTKEGATDDPTDTATVSPSATPTPTPVIKYQYEINYWSESGDEWVTKTGPERTNTVPQAEEEALLDEYTANCYKGDDDYYIDMQYTKWVTVNSATVSPA